MRRSLHIISTVLSLGLNLLIARLLRNPRWRRLAIALIILNELAGLARIYGAWSLT